MKQMNNKDGFIPAHGGYKNLQSYKKSEIIYDGMVYFCTRFFKRGDRTIDQMVQAARSGKQNITEASVLSGTSKEAEIKLTNVARASLEELSLVDFLIFMHYLYCVLNRFIFYPGGENENNSKNICFIFTNRQSLRADLI